MFEVVWLTFLGIWCLALFLLWGQLPSTLGLPLKAEPEKPIAGFLMARIDPPFAKVEVDGKDWPWQAEGRALLPGSYRLRVTAQDFHPQERVVRIHAEDATLVRISLDPYPVEISLSSNPSGSKAFLNGRLVGQTPLFLKLKPRAYRLRLSKPSFLPIEQDIFVVARPKKAQTWSFPLGGAQKKALDGGVRRWVPKGTFLRGLSDASLQKVYDLCRQFRKDCKKEWWSAEQPERLLEMSGFWIDAFEVTQARYQRCVSAGVCRPPRYKRNRSNLPVLGVSWGQAATYCRFAGGRLPHEAEWEYVARAAEGRLFVWGDRWVPGWANHGVFLPTRQTAGPWDGDGARFAAEVGRYPQDRSVFGVYDLAGNVAEWVSDCYHASYFRVAPEREPHHAPSKCSMRVVRGGSWSSPPWDLRATMRKPAPPESQALAIGFRCVEVPPATPTPP